MKKYGSLFLVIVFIMTSCGGPSKPSSKGGSTGGFQQSTQPGLTPDTYKPCRDKQSPDDLDGDCVRNENDADPNDPNVGLKLPENISDMTEDDWSKWEELMKAYQENAGLEPVDTSALTTMAYLGIGLTLAAGLYAAFTGDSKGVTQATQNAADHLEKGLTQTTQARTEYADKLRQERKDELEREKELLEKMDEERKSTEKQKKYTVLKNTTYKEEPAIFIGTSFLNDKPVNDKVSLKLYFPTDDQQQGTGHVWVKYETQSTVTIQDGDQPQSVTTNDAGIMLISMYKDYSLIFQFQSVDLLRPVAAYGVQITQRACREGEYVSENFCSDSGGLTISDDKKFCDIDKNQTCNEALVATAMKYFRQGYADTFHLHAWGYNFDTKSSSNAIRTEFTRDSDYKANNRPVCNAYYDKEKGIYVGFYDEKNALFTTKDAYTNQGVEFLEENECRFSDTNSGDGNNDTEVAF